jgi:hypothetical protein
VTEFIFCGRSRALPPDSLANTCLGAACRSCETAWPFGEPHLTQKCRDWSQPISSGGSVIQHGKQRRHSYGGMSGGDSFVIWAAALRSAQMERDVARLNERRHPPFYITKSLHFGSSGDSHAVCSVVQAACAVAPAAIYDCWLSCATRWRSGRLAPPLARNVHVQQDGRGAAFKLCEHIARAGTLGSRDRMHIV